MGSDRARVGQLMDWSQFTSNNTTKATGKYDGTRLSITSIELPFIFIDLFLYVFWYSMNDAIRGVIY